MSGERFEARTVEDLVRRVRALEEENARLRGLLGLDERIDDGHTTAWTPTLLTSPNERSALDATATENDKVALLRLLFGARADVFAVRWENASTGRAGWSPAVRGGWSRHRSTRDHLPLTDEVFARHVRGEMAAGIYPLLAGDTCALLACDFDRSSWALDALGLSRRVPRERRPGRVGTIAVRQRRARVGLLRRRCAGVDKHGPWAPHYCVRR